MNPLPMQYSSIEDLLNQDNTIFNSVDFEQLQELQNSSHNTHKFNKSKAQKFSLLSLKGRKEMKSLQRYETEPVNSSISKRPKFDSAPQTQSEDTSEDTFSNIDDTQTLIDNHNKLKDLANDHSLPTATNNNEQNKCKEFDAFSTYLNCGKENIRLSQLSQIFRESAAKEDVDFKTPSVPAQKSDDVFNETNRRDVEQFFDEVKNSITLMGTEFEAADEKVDRVLDALSSTETGNVMVSSFRDFEIPNNSSLANIDWDETIVSAATGIDASFGSAMKRALLQNANKSIAPQGKHMNLTLVTQNKCMFKNLGPFYGLPSRVKELIKLYRGIEKLYQWQNECLNLPAIKERRNLIYALPTSGGKTLVAEILMLREIFCYQKNALFVLPFVAIVQEKVWSLSPFAVDLDFLIEEYAASKGLYPPRKRRRKNSIFIATIEKAMGLLNSLIETGRVNELGLIVVDELHLVGEQGRGATLEALLTKIMYINANIHVVGMSATIGNINDISRFLNAEIYSQNFRPVELTEYIKCENEIARINWSSKEEELFTVVRNTDFGYSEALNNVDPDRLGGLVMEVIPTGSCLIFCPSKKNCENVAYLLCKVANRTLTDYRKEEKEHVKHALRDESGSLCKVFQVSIQFGIAYHHSGLTNEERRVIEDAFRAGVISVICCTSTLAAGVNLPAKRVILRQPYVGRDFINLSRYKQMVGRAGRAGLGEAGDSILICQSRDLPKVKKLLMSPMDRALSSLHEGGAIGLRHLLLSCISLGIANTRYKLQEVSKRTLLSLQAATLDVDVKKLTDKVISDLFKLGALEDANLKTPGKEEPLGDITIRMDTSTNFLNDTLEDVPKCKKKRKIVIKNDMKLAISKLGCAAIKGNFELTRAHMLYDDLHQAQKSLVLLDALHLLYLVTPYDIAAQIRPNKLEYYNIYVKLGPNELQTARVLGLTEAVAHRMLANQTINSLPETVLNRFYLALLLYDLWNEMPVFETSEKYQINRGVVQTLMTSAATFASNVVNFCEGLEEFWTFAHLLKGISQRLSHCCGKELVPLMELPAVKQSRAKQLFNAGYKNLQSIAKANPDTLVETVEFLPRKVAKQLVAAAKMLLLEKVENLRDEAEDVLDGVENPKSLMNGSIFN